MELININEAATLSGKSVQTIRRMIKQRKIQVKKQRTPQGFNYLVVKESLIEFFNKNTEFDLSDEQIATGDSVQTTEPKKADGREHRALTAWIEETFKNEFERFHGTMQKLIEQHEKDKCNFFTLIKTFQDRVFSLESQIKLLEAPKKSWWRFWR